MDVCVNGDRGGESRGGVCVVLCVCVCVCVCVFVCSLSCILKTERQPRSLTAPVRLDID